ncbi:MAG: TonB-dependent receptor [Burkholderiales bacterium]
MHSTGKFIITSHTQRPTHPLRRPLVVAVVATLMPFAAQAQTSGEKIESVDPIVVTATRRAQSGFDTPASIDSLSIDEIQNGQPQVNLSEALQRVPGLVVGNRQNYAQDLQISSRGFGSRSTFGLRGVRLIADDIPATMPDGQGQGATISLSSAKRIEVLRGPFSAIYGNSSGGVIQAFSEDGPAKPTLSLNAWGGSFDSHRFGLKFGGNSGPFNYVIDASRFDTEGYRDHSTAKRDHLNTKLKYSFENATLSLIANSLKQPWTQDPLGLSRAQFNVNPRSVDPTAIQFDTRKDIKNNQVGAVYEHRFSNNDTFRLVGYTGTRDITQFLALPVGAQIPATNSGGVINLDRKFDGANIRWTHQFAAPLTLTAGVDLDKSKERRNGYENFTGTGAAQILGVQGNLRRSEDNSVQNLDPYAQIEWQPAKDWNVIAGLRYSKVKFKSEDFFTNGPTNLDDSGSTDYTHTNPVLGVLYKINPQLNVYGNFGKGFETPTFAELAYKANAAGVLVSGLNFDLKPSESKNYELGLKARVNDNVHVNTAVFYILTENEILPRTNSGGRATFQNASETRRQGLEVGVDANLGEGFRAYGALTYLDARFSRGFTYRAAAGPAVTTVNGNNILPGAPATTGYGEISWKQAGDSGFHAAVEGRISSKVYVNDINSDAEAGNWIANLRGGYRYKTGNWDLDAYARIDNVFDEKYAGSVIVNEANGRYFEPAPVRNYTIGINAALKF